MKQIVSFMKTICDRITCTGCGLCVSQCPVHCITMKPGKLGHLFPVINKKRCIECGLCSKNCPSLNYIEMNPPQCAFAAWSKDDAEYKSSTSGAAASVLSESIIHHGGVVYGCSVLSGAIVEHIRIDKYQDLYKIKGSKYVQSSILKIIPQIKKDVEDNRLVLFIGTPCQTAAVKKLFLNKPHDNLFTVDLICHGTPSLKSLHKYLKQHVKLNRIENIQFRSGNEYIINVYSDNRIIYTSPPRDEDYYLSSFYDGLSIRDSCHQCIYAKSIRCSDITVGDFWGLGNELSSDNIPEHNYGVSLVLPNTDKGLKLFETVTEKMNAYERPVSEAVSGNDRLRYPKERVRWTKLYRLCQPVIGDKGAFFSVKLMMRFEDR